MEHPALTRIRDRSISTAEFRAGVYELAPVLMNHIQEKLPQQASITLIYILRAAVSFLDAGIRTFPSATVGIAGIRRDEHTAIAEWYYVNLPDISKDETYVIVDPMLATGGSADEVIQRLLSSGADARHIYFLGVIGAPEGLERITKSIPKDNVILGALDAGLDDKKFIVPGLGDFGDRFCGT